MSSLSQLWVILRTLAVIDCAQQYLPASLTAEATLEPASLTASGVFWFALESPGAYVIIPVHRVTRQVLQFLRAATCNQANIDTMTDKIITGVMTGVNSIAGLKLCSQVGAQQLQSPVETTCEEQGGLITQHNK